MKAASFIAISVEDLPPATFDGGVWHCEGKLVTRETAKTADEEALFWLAIAKAERRRTQYDALDAISELGGE